MNKKKIFLVLYGVVVFIVTVYYLAYGKVRDPRFYISMLVLVIVGKVIAGRK